MPLGHTVASPLPKECAAVVFELKKRPSPRSPSFTTPVAVINTLAGFMSGRERGKDTEREKVKVTEVFSGYKHPQPLH